jgi:hypothetical protein
MYHGHPVISKEIVSQTYDAVENFAVSPLDGFLHLKRDNSYGYIEFFDLVRGEFIVHIKNSNLTESHPDADKLITSGWVID